MLYCIKTDRESTLRQPTPQAVRVVFLTHHIVKSTRRGYIMTHLEDYGELYDITFRASRMITEYADSYFKIFSASIKDFKAHNPENKTPLNGTEVLCSHVPSLTIGNTYSATIRATDSVKYGTTFTIEGALTLVHPEDLNEYRAFLEKSFQGIGKTYSKRLVELFGMDVIDNILNNKRALMLAGVPDKVADKVKESAQQMTAQNRLIGFFHEFNIPVGVAIEVYNELGHSAREQVQTNPWILTSIDYMYLRYSDIIAKAFGFKAHDDKRISAGILAYLKHRMNDGHMGIYQEELFNGVDFINWLSRAGEYTKGKNLHIDTDMIGDQLDELKAIWILETPVDTAGNRMVYFRSTLRIEQEIVQGVSNFFSSGRPSVTDNYGVSDYLNALSQGDFLNSDEKQHGVQPFSPAEEQEQAIRMALTEPFSILTGGPGTGKTTVVNTIVQAIEYIDPQARIAMLAPTGRAAKRMSEITGRPAMTIHRKLNMHMTENEEDIVDIDEDYVVVDESSMVDAYLFSTLINHVSLNTKILLVGDVDQLPSVGSGAILRDLIDSSVVPTTRLLKVFRQAEESPIVSNAYKLNRGESVHSMNFADDSGMVFEDLNNDHLIRERIIEHVVEYSRKGLLDNIAVLSPMRRGLLGVTELNQKIQERVNPERKMVQQILMNGKTDLYLREGDRVMQIVNDTEKGVSNGETGTIDIIYDDITELDDGRKITQTCVDVIYPDAYLGEFTVTYTVREAREQLELAYATTIHKSQGSQYMTVIVPFVRDHKFMLKRNLIYTAWTRAEEQVINIGSRQWVDYASGNNDNVVRISQIKEKLEALSGKVKVVMEEKQEAELLFA